MSSPFLFIFLHSTLKMLQRTSACQSIQSLTGWSWVLMLRMSFPWIGHVFFGNLAPTHPMQDVYHEELRTLSKMQ